MLGDGEAKTRAAEPLGGRGIRLAERLEQPAELFRGHSNSSVRHPEADLGTTNTLHRQGQRTLAGELVGVAHQVKQALLDLGLIGTEAADIGRADHLDGIFTLIGERLDDRHHLLKQGLDVDRLDEDIHLPGLDLRQVEDVVDQPQQVPAGAFDLLQVVDRGLVVLVGGVLLQDFAVADDRIERRAQLV